MRTAAILLIYRLACDKRSPLVFTAVKVPFAVAVYYIPYTALSLFVAKG